MFFLTKLKWLLLKVICVEVFISFVLVFFTTIFLLIQQFDTQLTHWEQIQWKTKQNTMNKDQLRVRAFDWHCESSLTEKGWFFPTAAAADSYVKTSWTKHTKIQVKFLQVIQGHVFNNWIWEECKIEMQDPTLCHILFLQLSNVIWV